MIAPDLRAVLARAEQLLREGAAAEARRVLEGFAAQSRSQPDVPQFHAMLAQACLGAGDPAMARTAIERAIGLHPDWPQAYHLHALALRDLGLLDDAARSIHMALQRLPGDVRAWTTCGTIQRRLGQLADAETAFRRAVALSPGHEAAWRGLAETLQSVQQDDAAVEAWRRWVELQRGVLAARLQFGWALARMHRWKAAEVELSAGIESPDARATDATRLAFVRREAGDADGALAALGRGAQLDPHSLTPRFGVSLFLPQVYDDATDMRRWRERYAQGLEDLEAEVPRLMAEPEALWQLDWSNFYLAYQGENDLQFQQRYAGLIATLAGAAAPDWMVPIRPRRPRERLRIGFASSFFRDCTVGSYFSPWLTGLERNRFEVHAFYFGAEIDVTTIAIRRRVEHFEHLPLGVRQIASAIRAADLDVLVYPQLGMDGRDATLAALRLAPVQCAAWGHPETTGSGAIDCFFSCADMEPGDGAGHYSERLLCLPGLGTRYARPELSHMNRAQLGLPGRERLYVCPHSLFKITPDNDAMFADLLTRDPGARLVLCADIGLPVTTRFRERLAGTLRRSDVDFDRRVLLQPLRPPPEFRAMLSACDVMLDTLHWSGGNTSLDALAAGLPIVTCPGPLMRGRQSAAMLREIGLQGLVCDSPAEAVTRAIEVASETGEGGGIREQIVRNRDALFDRPEPILALEQYLLALCGRVG